jgi:2-polyprenyl-3-methyl-5-hydroxy-6-metoxy-1,4-benzoquinol methylase
VLNRFLDLVASQIGDIKPTSTLEFGCGEGYFYRHLVERGVSLGNYVGIDLRDGAIEEARSINPGADFRCVDLFHWPPENHSYDLVIAAEVFEHLPEPKPYLQRLTELCAGRLLLTVPNEPWFRLSNLARGRDISRFGNHPEHVNHWNARSFARFVGDLANVELVRTAFPFVVLVAKAERAQTF